MAAMFREQWQQIWDQVYADGDEQLKDGLLVAMENASTTVAEEGLTNQDERWFQTAIWTWDQWKDDV